MIFTDVWDAIFPFAVIVVSKSPLLKVTVLTGVEATTCTDGLLVNLNITTPTTNTKIMAIIKVFFFFF